ncbi:MAG: GNAT family N-acetyltransferase [Butyricicoccaceae bacterium]
MMRPVWCISAADRMTAAEALPLYRAAGWTAYTEHPAQLEAALGSSLCVLEARAGGRLIGLLRAVGDGVTIVYIQDILVLPAWRRQGVGRALIQALRARYSSVRQIVLLTDDRPETCAFYRSAGFRPAGEWGCAAFAAFGPALDLSAPAEPAPEISCVH